MKVEPKNGVAKIKIKNGEVIPGQLTFTPLTLKQFLISFNKKAKRLSVETNTGNVSIGEMANN